MIDIRKWNACFTKFTKAWTHQLKSIERALRSEMKKKYLQGLDAKFVDWSFHLVHGNKEFFITFNSDNIIVLIFPGDFDSWISKFLSKKRPQFFFQVNVRSAAILRNLKSSDLRLWRLLEFFSKSNFKWYLFHLKTCLNLFNLDATGLWFVQRLMRQLSKCSFKYWFWCNFMMKC